MAVRLIWRKELRSITGVKSDTLREEDHGKFIISIHLTGKPLAFYEYPTWSFSNHRSFLFL